MRIGIVAPIWLQIPPRKYGGTEEVVYNLTQGLVKNGHDVTLFGPRTAQVSAKIIPTVDKPLIDSGIGWRDPQSYNVHILHYLEAFSQVDKFDVLHLHMNKVHDFLALMLVQKSRVPVVCTLHFPAPTLDYEANTFHIFSKFAELPLTSISNAARSGNRWNFIRTIYNSINIANFPYSSITDDYFAWIGKALPKKGLKEAIVVAKKAKVKLKIMAAIDKNWQISVDYFEKDIKPLIDGKQIEYLGEADIKMKAEVLGKAKAFINPIQWPEPFGMVMAESQAVGTPVIVLNKGAAAELVVDGKTGYVVDSIDDMIRRISHISHIRRIDCRKHVEAKFTRDKMIHGYENAYKKVIKNWDKYRHNQQKLLPL